MDSLIRILGTPGVPLAALIISPDEIAARLSNDDAPHLIDARSIRTRHLDGRAVPGSKTLSAGALEESFDGVPKDREIVLYCGCPCEKTAVRVAHLLHANGFANVQLLDGGLDGWAAAGHPVQTLREHEEEPKPVAPSCATLE